jgi:SAM-dependent methyltransferase
MKPKPAGLGPEFGRQFNDASMVAAYKTRPPYPEQLLALILEVAGAPSSHLLELGCGTAELARRLAPRVASVTAVDQSDRMITEGRTLPGGDAPNLRWVLGAVEDVALSGVFTVAIAAESFHWFDWARACPRIAEWVPSARLVLVEGRVEEPTPWARDLRALIARYSTNRQFAPYCLVDELAARSCFVIEGRSRIGPTRFQQSIDDYVTSIHSRNGFSQDRMSSSQSRAFDAAVREHIAPHAHEGVLTLEISTQVAWGKVSSLVSAQRVHL